ncbi:hypothetical protein B0I37DRAFT_374288 [Chaetomium sp. MPI-CAGE-AT-0009]|nr:hypothetical protein B0I37DRAFT_374288 [Chaetomium sp. MPI-CAGE-AT-0009]
MLPSSAPTSTLLFVVFLSFSCLFRFKISSLQISKSPFSARPPTISTCLVTSPASISRNAATFQTGHKLHTYIKTLYSHDLFVELFDFCNGHIDIARSDKDVHKWCRGTCCNVPAKLLELS